MIPIMTDSIKSYNYTQPTHKEIWQLIHINEKLPVNSDTIRTLYKYKKKEAK